MFREDGPVELTHRGVSIEVVNKVGDGIIKCCGGDAVVVLAVVYELKPFSLVHTDQDVVVEEFPLLAE